ncbi:MAG: pantetheine-phosphate adenylyltransferase [Defluviitaleaceae bacterium]|nr:pantetheine-phosphate adenylyltransferase [Defluviitaleaceae bacterium]
MSAIYPGSFDPVTNGHINIARRSAAILGRVVVAVLDNPRKTPLFSVKERVAMLRKVFFNDYNIEIESFSGLLADYAHKKDIHVIIRGLRGPEDLSKELPYSIWNQGLGLTKPVETIYFTAEPSLAHISSSIVKEVANYAYKNNRDDIFLASTIPPEVHAALKEKLQKSG